MDPAIVGSDQFGMLWSKKLLGTYRGYNEQIFSQPLVYTPGDGTQYVYVATTMNIVYKINAKTGDIVLSRTLHVPFLVSDLDGCIDINPLVGVTGTGVIDPDTGTWYLTSKTYRDQTDVEKGRLNGRYYVHAIDVNTLDEKPGFPINLEGTLGRNNPTRMFQGGNAHQRPALIHESGFFYAGFASHCVQYNFTGWIIGWDGAGNVVESFVTEGGPEDVTIKGGGVWMSGGGLASDGAGSLYFATGNGYASQLHGNPVPGRSPPSSLEEAAVHMTIAGDGKLTPVDFFMPWEKEQLDGADKDLGTSPLELLPSSTFTCPNSRRLGVVTGKSGKTYFLNIDNLGGYSNGPNKLDAVPQVFQNENSVYAGAGVYPLEGGYVYINVIQFPTRIFKFSCDDGGNAVFTQVALTNEKNAFILGVGHGTTTSLNGQPGSGLFWVTDVQGFNLRVYKAVPQNGALQLIKTANIPGTTKFTRPVFGDGRAYIGTTQGLLYAFGSPVNLPITCSSPYDFGDGFIGNSSGNASSPLTVSCKANINVQVTAISLDSHDFAISGLPTLPYALTAGQNISFTARFTPTTPGSLSDDIYLNTTNGVAGYSTRTPISLKGNGRSSTPVLAITPNTVTFSGIITGQQPGGVTQSFIISNQGDTPLNITSYDFSQVSEGGPTVTPNGTASAPKVGPFTFTGLPSTIPASTSVTVNVNFDPSTSGGFAVYLTVKSNGGTKVVDIIGNSGTYPRALIEFQKPDKSGWVTYDNSTPFTFGDVFEKTTKDLLMRLTNTGGNDSSSLSVTVSKPPVGEMPVGAANSIDLAEGTILAPGQSATASLYCAVPYAQVNTDSYNGSAQWTMNTGDPTFGKQFIQFTCNAVAEQVGPLYPNGSAEYRYLGCYKENNPGRQLQNQIYGSQSNENGRCTQACFDAGYTFAGTQYHSECWCGNNLPNLLTDKDNCNFVCAGNASQICGGNGFFTDGAYISLFADAKKYINGTTIPGAPTGGPIVNPGDGQFNSLGCYTEATTGRALSKLGVATDTLTITSCFAACAGYQYAGAEYGRECKSSLPDSNRYRN
ncbi:MAG: hypothetical protein M1813_003305 [Trichoglossum hirsutum]|nr:MAG: hypothetical protein M1813_003305 [Trichoglossum hirsutum]